MLISRFGTSFQLAETLILFSVYDHIIPAGMSTAITGILRFLERVEPADNETTGVPVEQVVYTSEDRSLSISDRRVRYPVNALLETTVTSDDEVKVILLSKNDEYSFSQQHTDEFIAELNQSLSSVNVKPVVQIIDTEFSQNKLIHEQLMGRLVEEIDDGSHILVDITYGPKGLPSCLSVLLWD